MTAGLALAAGVLLRRETHAGPLFLLLRHRERRDWGFPKGHLDPGETLTACAIRECAEETGIALLAIDGTPRFLNYALPDGRRKRVAYFPARTAQKRVTLSAEHDQGLWLAPPEVAEHLGHPDLVRLFRGILRSG